MTTKKMNKKVKIANYYTAEDARRVAHKYYKDKYKKYIDSDIIKFVLDKIKKESQKGKVGLILNELNKDLSVDEMIEIGTVLEKFGYKTIIEMSNTIIISWR